MMRLLYEHYATIFFTTIFSLPHKKRIPFRDIIYNIIQKQKSNNNNDNNNNDNDYTKLTEKLTEK